MPGRYAADLAHRLGRHAEAVCRHYLSSGRRQGNYWLVGDVRNAPGRSTFVRLKDSARGPAGKWTDAATDEHGDLLDVIRETLGLIDFKDVVAEARAFLAEPHPEPEPSAPALSRGSAPPGSPEAAKRLVSMAQPIAGTLVARYLRGRAVTVLAGTGALRFHPRCYYRPDENGPTQIWPAMIAAVTDLSGRITGAHRTWLDPNGFDPVRLGKAPIETPRKAMGLLLGNAVRFGAPGEVLVAGEGIETMLSLRQVLPGLPAVAALSAAHLAAIRFPPGLRRLYIVRDLDPAGNRARETLRQRARDLGIEALDLSPALGDFNEDLRRAGEEPVAALVRNQLLRCDAISLMVEAA